MKQAIAGVAPSSLEEVTTMTVWPTLGSSGMGRWWGRMYAIKAGIRVFGIPVTVGRLIALASIPFILPPFFLALSPGLAIRYRLTNRRVVIQKQAFGLSGKFLDESSVPLDRFDAIDIEILPGQEWFKAGDLIFRDGTTETFRLTGVSRPETFRQTCLKARNAHVGVMAAITA